LSRHSGRSCGALGYVEGKTFVLQIRYGEAKAERLRELARDLVALKMDVIVVAQDQAIAAVKREAGTSIPIVMSNSSDPVGTGFVASLAHPGGNITGLSNVSPELSGKRLELLRQVLPGLSRVAFLWNPDVRGNLLDYKETEGAARSLRVELQSVEVSSDEDLDRGFSAVMAQHAQALILPAGNAVAFSKRPRSRASRRGIGCQPYTQTMTGWTPAASCPMDRAVLPCTTARPSTWTGS
jgi:putative ABC transport system substrate-binding protein